MRNGLHVEIIEDTLNTHIVEEKIDVSIIEDRLDCKIIDQGKIDVDIIEDVVNAQIIEDRLDVGISEERFDVNIIESANFAVYTTNHVVIEKAKGVVNSSNREFYTSYSYLPGSLNVLYNGVFLDSSEFAETDNYSGLFTLDFAPISDDLQTDTINVIYIRFI